MKIRTCSLLIVACCIVGWCGCNSDDTVVSQVAAEWSSDNFDVSAVLGGGWVQADLSAAGDTFDRPGNLLRAFANDAGPYSYVIKIERDAPLDQLSLEDYLDANRAQYTNYPAYELVDEGPVEFHSRQFYRFRLRFNGAKGMGAMYAHVFRDGKNLVSVQWTFPLGNAAQLSVPENIVRFDEGVTLGLISQSNE